MTNVVHALKNLLMQTRTRLAFAFIQNFLCKIYALTSPATYHPESICKNQRFISMQITPVFLSPREHEPQLLGTGVPDHIVEILFEMVLIWDKRVRFVAARTAGITSVAVGEPSGLPTKHAEIEL